MNTLEMTRIKNTQLASFNDTCQIYVFTSASNAYGEIIKSYSASSIIQCGYKSNLGTKTYGDETIRMKYSAIFRIDENTPITSNDHIVLTKVSGSSISPITYKISALDHGHGIFIIGADNVEV